MQDPASGERIPTCHRASFDSILNDVDYQAALKYSDGVARSLYEKEAQRIASLQKDILAISQKETPFDVFICYKESDENGKRTKDSALAQDIYYQLTDAGYKVFFARITLEDKLGQEYEPYIFAALHSAKVMVVVGTKPEYLNAVWVKNEWSRYLALMRTDRSRLLIPCYRDMDPYDMPEELSMLQSQDMGKIGFIQDLIRGVKKVVDAAKPQEAVTETVKETVVVHNEGGSNVQALLKRGNMALEDGEWSKADEFFEQVLNQDAECGAAYLGKFLSKVREASVQAYVQSNCAKIADAVPTKRNGKACAEDQAFIDACVEKYQVPEYYDPADIRAALHFDLTYCADQAAYFRDAQKKAMQRLDDDRNFARAEKFADSETKAQCESLRTGLTNALRQQEQKAEQEAAAEKQRVTEAYRAFLKETEPKLAAKQKQALAKQEDEQKRKEEFDRLRAEQKKRAEEATRLAGQKAREDAAKARKRMIFGTVAAIVIIAAVLLITKVIIPGVTYSKAEKLLSAGNYDSAIAAYEKLGNYKNAKECVFACKYEKAVNLLETGKSEDAISIFEDMSDYKDSQKYIADYYTNLYGSNVYQEMKNTEVGDTITMGTYEQDGDVTNGAEPIEWLVLKKDKFQFMLISKYCLDCKEYNYSYVDTTWEFSSIRKWLNGSFFNTAFEEAEQSQILETDINNSVLDSIVRRSKETVGGNDTVDKVFLLSADEVNEIWLSNNDRIAKATTFAKENGAFVVGSNCTVWWLRSPGFLQSSATFVDNAGGLDESGGVSVSDIAVRPVIWIDIRN